MKKKKASRAFLCDCIPFLRLWIFGLFRRVREGGGRDGQQTGKDLPILFEDTERAYRRLRRDGQGDFGKTHRAGRTAFQRHFAFRQKRGHQRRKGEVLGSFAEVFASLNKTIIPVLCLADEAAADAAIKFLKEEIDILDLAVMSENPLLVRKVKEQNGKIRGIVSYPAGRGTLRDRQDDEQKLRERSGDPAEYGDAGKRPLYSRPF